jgi:hypothetical protein
VHVTLTRSHSWSSSRFSIFLEVAQLDTLAEVRIGVIAKEVMDYHFQQFPQEERVVRALLSSFSANWASRKKAFNTQLSAYFLGPDKHMMETFGFDREVLMVISDFDTLQPRMMQAIESILNESLARGRVDQTLFILVTRASNGREWTENYVAANPQSRMPIVFNFSTLESKSSDSWYVRNVIMDQLFSRDIFNYQLPIDNDLFFFGRDAIVADHLDAIRRSENRGLFGLRKTGKTSILYKVKRMSGLLSTLTVSCRPLDRLAGKA